MSALSGSDCEDRRWFVQSYDVRGVRGRILLALYEGDKRSSLLKVVFVGKCVLMRVTNRLFCYCCSPSGCTFWGKKPWSRKKKILWQLGTLVGAPVGIALVAGITVPAMIIGLVICFTSSRVNIVLRILSNLYLLEWGII